jgi:hypothetical protein
MWVFVVVVTYAGVFFPTFFFFFCGCFSFMIFVDFRFCAMNDYYLDVVFVGLVKNVRWYGFGLDFIDVGFGFAGLWGCGVVGLWGLVRKERDCAGSGQVCGQGSLSEAEWRSPR